MKDPAQKTYDGDGFDALAELVENELEFMAGALCVAHYERALCVTKVAEGPGLVVVSYGSPPPTDEAMRRVDEAFRSMGEIGRWEFSTRTGQVVGATHIMLRADSIDIHRSVVPVAPVQFVDLKIGFAWP